MHEGFSLLNHTQDKHFGAKQMTYNLVKVAKAPVMVCLKCPLCSNLVHEATTISECLHTFCRDCIYQQLGDGESDCCPICNVNLGCSPLEKLRADHQLDDVRAKIFPVKLKKRKVVENNVECCDAPAPVRRKERSLSSLGISAVPPSAHPGFVSRRTKSVSRRSMMIKDMSADNECEDTKLDKVKSRNFGAERDGSEGEGFQGNLEDEYTSDEKVGTGSEEKHEIPSFAKREIISDEERGAEIEALQHHTDPLSFCRREMPPYALQEQSKVKDHSSNGGDPVSKLGMYLAERSRVSTTGRFHTEGPEVPDQHEKIFVKHGKTEPNDRVDQKLPASFSVVRERTGKDMKKRSALAELAELAVGQAVETCEPFKARGPRARRGRGKRENSKTAAVGENLNWHPVDNSACAAASNLQSNFQPPVRSSSLAKLPIVRKMPSSKRTPTNSTSIAKQSTDLWFALQAADNQMGDNALPQISTRYLHIKDRKLPVSIVKKYLVKKLDLKCETEVEITCRGQPVVPNLPLERVQGIWFANMPSSDLLPSLKEVNAAPSDSRKLPEVKGRSAEDCMMVLTYGRHRRPMVGP